VEVLERPTGHGDTYQHAHPGTLVAQSSSRTRGDVRAVSPSKMHTGIQRHRRRATVSWLVGGILVRLGGTLRRRRREEPETVLSRHETSLLIDKLARRDFGMSGAEFVRKSQLGKMPDTSAAHAIMMLTGVSDQ